MDSSCAIVESFPRPAVYLGMKLGIESRQGCMIPGPSEGEVRRITIPMIPVFSDDVAQTAVDTVAPPAMRDRGRYSIITNDRGRHQ